MALAVEIVQLFNLERGTAVWDLISGLIGGVLAIFSGAIYIRFIADSITRWWRFQFKANPVIVAAALLTVAICWDAARPFYIISSGNELSANIKNSVVIPFEPPGRDIREQIGIRKPSQLSSPVQYTADYYAKVTERFLLYGLLCVLFTYRVNRKKMIPALLQYLSVVFAVELINLGVVHGHCDITRIIIGLIDIPFALFGVTIFSRKPKLGLMALLGLNVLYIVIGSLRPYQFGQMAALSIDNFIPLMSAVRSTDVMQLANVVESVVIFAPVGMILYLNVLRNINSSNHIKWPSAQLPIVICGVLGFLMETAQLWLPTRTPAVEDALFAAIGGFAGVSAARIYHYYTSPIKSGYTEH
jgi:VanZ family protein